MRGGIRPTKKGQGETGSRLGYPRGGSPRGIKGEENHHLRKQRTPTSLCGLDEVDAHWGGRGSGKGSLENRTSTQKVPLTWELNDRSNIASSGIEKMVGGYIDPSKKHSHNTPGPRLFWGVGEKT